VQPGAIFWYVTRGIDKTWNNTGGVGKYRVINAQVTIKKPEDEHPVTISHKPVDITGSPCNGNPVRNFEPETAVIPAVAGLPV
jgi:hypothetical protein